MDIELRKISDDRHTLAIVRPNGEREQVDCETRSYLLHDLLHYSLESEARLSSGFWGLLASGVTLAAMNDRTGRALGEHNPAMNDVEWVVGALHGATRGLAPADLFAALNTYAQSSERTIPAWLTLDVIERACSRLREVLGRWKATPYGATMTLSWTVSLGASTSPMQGERRDL